MIVDLPVSAAPREISKSLSEYLLHFDSAHPWCNRPVDMPTDTTPNTPDAVPTINEDELGAGNSNNGPSSPPALVKSHPNREEWPSWLSDAVTHLEDMIGSSQWRLVLCGWLDIEHELGYPEGKVRQ
jgi:hypothetical protein